MSKPPRPHGGFLVKDGQCYPMTVQQVLARYDAWLAERARLTIVSDELGILIRNDELTMTIPHTSQVYEHLRNQLSQGFVHGWYQLNPGQFLTPVIDQAGDQLIEDFGIDEFQIVRSRAATHDEQHMAYLASLPTTLPPAPPRLKLIK